MSEAKCVCGCTKDEHSALQEKSYYPESRCVETWDACDKHNCENYRPVLPWPESEGWWWCSNGRLYEFVRHQGKFMAWWDDGDLTDADLYSLHYPGEQAPRFTRLLEPNPFGK